MIGGGITGGTVLLSCCVWSVVGLDISVLLVRIGGLVVLLVASILLVTDSLSVSVLPIRLYGISGMSLVLLDLA